MTCRGVTVDGQSAVEMHNTAGEAVERARSGAGPTLVEARTYRYMGHFGADNPLKYRTKEEEEYHRNRDCIENLRSYILYAEYATEETLAVLDAQAAEAVATSVAFAEESPFPEAEELVTDVYSG